MCGIAGIITTNHGGVEQKLKRAGELQKHRGPDFQGYSQHSIDNFQVGFAHQRLSILDLSEGAHQPFTTNQKQVLIYNGEIYNFKEIRTELEREGIEFKTSSDTEVLYYSLKKWGVDETTSKLNGMWAFAYLDLEQKTLELSRDRFGIKPLYYYRKNDEFYFSSEIKTLLDLSEDKFRLNFNIVGQYINQNLVEADLEETFFQDVLKLKPATNLKIELGKKSILISEKPFYSLSNQIKEQAQKSFKEEDILELFQDAVEKRLVSDVPLGVLLSGGIDSSSICSITNKKLSKRGQKLLTLSAISDDSRFDESEFITEMVKYLQSDQSSFQLKMDPQNAFSLLSKLNWHNDEPVSSFSNVAHFLLIQNAAKENLKVILSGQGADEIFCGYKKFLGFYLISMLKKGDFFGFAKTFGAFVCNNSILNQFKIHEAKRYLPSFISGQKLDINGENLEFFKPVNIGLSNKNDVSLRQFEDVTKYSVPSLVHTEDRMSMASSVEIRVPFLDHRLVERAISLPISEKIHNGWTKYKFRKAIEPHLPASITWRKDKKGFVNPQSEWLRNELVGEIKGIFGDSESLIYRNGLISKPKIVNKYQKYISQSEDYGDISFKEIFAPMNLEIWLRKFESYLR